MLISYTNSGSCREDAQGGLLQFSCVCYRTRPERDSEGHHLELSRFFKPALVSKLALLSTGSPQHEPQSRGRWREMTACTCRNCIVSLRLIPLRRAPLQPPQASVPRTPSSRMDQVAKASGRAFSSLILWSRAAVKVKTAKLPRKIQTRKASCWECPLQEVRSTFPFPGSQVATTPDIQLPANPNPPPSFCAMLLKTPCTLARHKLFEGNRHPAQGPERARGQ